MASDPSSSRLEAHLDTLLVVRSSVGDGEAAHEFRGSAFVLSHYSPYLRAALAKEWAQGEGKRVELTEDPQAFGHLLEFMHSMGSADKLPSEADVLMCLLAVAHTLGVEACVAAAASRLTTQAGELDWDAAVRALAAVEGWGCSDAEASSQLELLHRAVLCRVLQLLGSLDEMMNDLARRDQFCRLPLPVLEAVYASDGLQLDLEETAFCAFAHWLHSQEGLSLSEQMAAAACILPHIRLAAMRAPTVVNYWHAYRWFREWDSAKLALIEALVFIAEPSAAAINLPAKRHADVPAAVSRRMVCPALPPKLSFVCEIDVTEPGAGPLEGTSHYWAGAWWRAYATQSNGGTTAEPKVAVRLACRLPPGAAVASEGLIGSRSVGLGFKFQLDVADYAAADGGGEPQWRSSAKSQPCVVIKPLLKVDLGRSPPWVGHGWDWFPFKVAMPDGSPIRWTNFRQPGSPVVRGGKMLVRVTASLAGAGQ